MVREAVSGNSVPGVRQPERRLLVPVPAPNTSETDSRLNPSVSELISWAQVSSLARAGPQRSDTERMLSP